MKRSQKADLKDGLESRRLFDLVGKLVVFEGADGAGKTTVSEAVLTYLLGHGIPCQRFSFPGHEGRTVGRLVYDLHHDSRSRGVDCVTPTSLQALHVAAHLDAIERLIVPALRAGSCVLLDRYWWSTWVYGRLSGVKSSTLGRLVQVEKSVWGRIRPSIILYLRRGTRRDAAAIEYEALAAREARAANVVSILTRPRIEETRQIVLKRMTIHR